MGRNVHEVVMKEFEGQDWQRIGESICSSYSKFAERLIIWDALDMDGCGEFFATPAHIVSAAWKCRHDVESQSDIRSIFAWLRKQLNDREKSYKEYADEYIRFNVS